MHIRTGDIRARLHNPGQGHQSDPVSPDRVRQLFQTFPHILGGPYNSRSPYVRSSGKRIDLGSRPFKGYIHCRQGRLSSSVLPEDQQQRSTAQHPPRPGWNSDASFASVRGDAVGTIILSDTLAAHDPALPHYVYAYVCCRNRTQIQDEG